MHLPPEAVDSATARLGLAAERLDHFAPGCRVAPSCEAAPGEGVQMPKIKTRDLACSPYREYTDLLAKRLKQPGEFGASDWLAMQKAMQAALWDHATGVKP